MTVEQIWWSCQKLWFYRYQNNNSFHYGGLSFLRERIYNPGLFTLTQRYYIGIPITIPSREVVVERQSNAYSDYSSYNDSCYIWIVKPSDDELAELVLRLP